MNYIYDIMLNFKDSKKILEPFEWDSGDEIINIKKSPVFRVCEKLIQDICNYNIKIDDNINKYQATLYKQTKKKYKYTIVLSDTYMAIGVLLDENGNVIRRSKMLYDEEEEALSISLKENISNIKYKKIKKIEKDEYITRDDEERKEFLIKEFKYLYEHEDIVKLKYLYIEYFRSKCDDIKEIYNALIKSLDNMNDKHKAIYNLLKMSYKR